MNKQTMAGSSTRVSNTNKIDEPNSSSQTANSLLRLLEAQNQVFPTILTDIHAGVIFQLSVHFRV